MRLLKEYISYAKERFSSKSYATIKHALAIAIANSRDMYRYDGSPFVHHPIGVALIVSKEMGLGAITSVSALLHDIVRRGVYSMDQVKAEFSEDVVAVLMGMNDISSVETNTEDGQIVHFQELIVSYSTSSRIILLKLADRLEVMRSLHMFPEVKRTKKAWEALNIYSQLAHKLGLYNVKSEMEDISLSYLEPDDFFMIKNKLEATADAREDFIGKFIAPIKSRLNNDNFKFSIKGRTKSIYSIWRKMKKQKISFEEVYDVFAIRIIIDCDIKLEKSLCWHVYSVVTEFNNPNPKRMRDWISIPKSNGYESLHATVVTAEGKWVEVQIRTDRMDAVAEQGIAAHWRYKGVSGGDSGAAWLQQLREVVENMNNGMNSDVAKVENNNKEIFVFTPNGDLRKLPKGATVLDFAFDIHSNIGNKCVGARINHSNATIKDKLKNGDLVEIVTSKNQKPKSSWLNIVVTSKAKSRIKVFLRDEEVKLASLAREELERKIKNWKLAITLDEAVSLLTRYYKAKNGREFLGDVLDQKHTMPEIKELLVRHLSGENILRTTDERAPVKEKKGKEKKGDYLIIDRNQTGMDYKLAKCCNPVFGDEIFSFVTVMNGITIHRSDCVNAESLRERYPYRILPAKWNETQTNGAFIAKIAITSDDVIGLEHSIRDELRGLKTVLRSMNLAYDRDGVKGHIMVEVPAIGYLDTIVYHLLRIKGVRKAARV